MRGRDEGMRGLRPYYALNPLRGGASSLAKASEDMSKGARGRRGEEKFEIRPAVAGHAHA